MIPAFAPNAVEGLFRSYAAYWAFRDAGSGAASLTADVGTNAAITRATNATCFDSTGTLVTISSNVARFDYDPSTLVPRGLLVEEQRVNSIRNNTMQGASPGTPGTLPTNWASSLSGLTQTIIGTGTSNGITYIDVRFNGTAGATTLDVYFETTSGVAATNGQTWTPSTWVAIVGGSTTNVTAVRVCGYIYTAVPAFSSNLLGSSTITLTSTLTRYDNPATISDASTAYIRSLLRLNVTNGGAVDITLRIGLPQLELGATATSVIATTSAAATRNADNVVVSTISPWFSATEGTVVVEGDVNATTTDGTARILWSFGDGTANEIMSLTRAASSANLNASVVDGGVSQANITGGAATANTTFKSAFAYKANDFAHSVNGAAAVTDTSGTLPTVTSLAIGNSSLSGATNYANGHIRRLAYYNTRLTNAQLQALSAL